MLADACLTECAGARNLECCALGFFLHHSSRTKNPGEVLGQLQKIPWVYEILDVPRGASFESIAIRSKSASFLCLLVYIDTRCPGSEVLNRLHDMNSRLFLYRRPLLITTNINSHAEDIPDKNGMLF